LEGVISGGDGKGKPSGLINIFVRIDPENLHFVGSCKSIPNDLEGYSIVAGKPGIRCKENLILGQERIKSRLWASFPGWGQEQYPHQYDTQAKAMVINALLGMVLGFAKVEFLKMTG
jgi:hypothetical protein